ncbi:MAG: LysR substrate-binding domain-containing protein [Pseudomonadales bacterium]
MKNLPLDILRSFVAVADLGSFTAAAERVGRSQPALSLQIKKLEGKVQASVFDRNGHKLALSHTGQLLYDYARQMLALNDEVISLLTLPAVSGSLRFGIPSEFASTLLPRIVGQFSQAYPQITLDVVCDLSKNLMVKKARAEFDLVLALHEKQDADRAGLVQIDKLVWVGPAARSHYDEQSLPLVLAPSPCIYRHRAMSALGEQGRNWRIAYTNSDLSGLTAAIEAGLGITVLAQSVVPPNLRIIRDNPLLPQLGSIDISLVYDRRKSDEALHRLVDFVLLGLKEQG